MGQNQILTQGKGHELYEVAAADWIHVQQGDRLGLWQGYGVGRGKVPHSSCGLGEDVADFGVVKAQSSNRKSDFSSQLPTLFSSSVTCLVFSYRAVIHPVSVCVCMCVCVCVCVCV